MIALLMGLKTISPAALHDVLGTATVLDVNAPGSWARARVPGARALDAAAFTERDLPADKDALAGLLLLESPVPEGAERGEARDRDGLPAGAGDVRGDLGLALGRTADAVGRLSSRRSDPCRD